MLRCSPFSQSFCKDNKKNPKSHTPNPNNIQPNFHKKSSSIKAQNHLTQQKRTPPASNHPLNPKIYKSKASNPSTTTTHINRKANHPPKNTTFQNNPNTPP